MNTTSSQENSNETSYAVTEMTAPETSVYFLQTNAVSRHKTGTPTVTQIRLFQAHPSYKLLKQVRKIQAHASLSQSQPLPTRPLHSLLKYLTNGTKTVSNHRRQKRSAETTENSVNSTTTDDTINVTNHTLQIENSTKSIKHPIPLVHTTRKIYISVINPLEAITLIVLLALIISLIMKKSRRKSALLQAAPLLTVATKADASLLDHPHGIFVKKLDSVHPFTETLPLLSIIHTHYRRPVDVFPECQANNSIPCQYSKALFHASSQTSSELQRLFQSLSYSPWSPEVENYDNSPFTDQSYQELNNEVYTHTLRIPKNLRTIMRRKLSSHNIFNLVDKSRHRGHLINLESYRLLITPEAESLFQDYKTKLNIVNQVSSLTELYARQNMKNACNKNQLSTQVIMPHQLQELLQEIQAELTELNKKLLIPPHQANTMYTLSTTTCISTPEVTLIRTEIPIVNFDDPPQLFHIKPLHCT